MLAAGAYSFRQKSRLAIALSWIGGYVNVVALLATAHVVSHTTGNVTSLAERISEARWGDAGILTLIVVSFTLGAMLAAMMTHQNRRSRSSASYLRPVAAQMMLLSLFALGIVYLQTHESSSAISLGVACIAAMAMGLQNATITRISDSVVRTTHLTGVFTDLGIEAVQLLFWMKDRKSQFKSHRLRRLIRVTLSHPAFLRMLLLASIIGSFVLGVIAGSWAYMYLPLWAMLPPVLFLGGLILLDWMQPISQVRQIRFQDPSQPLASPTQWLEPQTADLFQTQRIGIYGLFNPRGQRPHRAPNFQQWALTQGIQWPVMVLMLNARVHIDTNAAMDLLHAAEILRKSRHHLIITGLTRSQRVKLQQHKLDLLLGRDCLNEDVGQALVNAQKLLAETILTSTDHHSLTDVRASQS